MSLLPRPSWVTISAGDFRQPVCPAPVPEALDPIALPARGSLPKGPQVIVPDTGHDIPNRRPDAVAEAIIDGVGSIGCRIVP